LPAPGLGQKKNSGGVDFLRKPYVDRYEKPGIEPSPEKSEAETMDIVFGRRDQRVVENSFRINYTFTNTMNLSFRARHYWTSVQYDSFHLLMEDGRLGPIDYADNEDANFNAFNIDMVYRWRYAPGSDIIFVYKNNIGNADDRADLGYLDNVNNLFNNPQSNSVSLKIIYFLDYAEIVRNRGPRSTSNSALSM